MGDLPLVSVLIPIRNAAPFVQAAIESVLRQTGGRVEVLAIDNGSTDRSAEVVRGLLDARIRVVSSPELGIAAALNRGLAEARGAFIARCDADDRYPDDRLAGQLSFLMNHTECDAVCGSYTTTDGDGRFVNAMDCGTRELEITGELRRGTTRTSLCTFTMRREAVDRVAGGFRPWFVTAEDIDFQLRFAEVGRVFYEPRSVYCCRLHDASITHTQSCLEREFYEQTARVFAQQRAERGTDDLACGRPPSPPVSERPSRRDAREHIHELLIGRAWRHHASGQKWLAVKTGLTACLRRPEDLEAWKSLATLVVKRGPRRPSGESGS